MKNYLDTEFLEGPQTKKFLGIPYGKTKPTIDLISIGIVAEDGREYYAISKDFNLDEAWNRYELKEVSGESVKSYWIRDNVLMPIAYELSNRYNEEDDFFVTELKFNKGTLKMLIEEYGKTNKQIAEEVKDFVNSEPVEIEGNKSGAQWLSEESQATLRRGYIQPSFYAYYADYDWVCFAWLFGRMIDLPTGFPMYCIDLKQMLDEKADVKKEDWFNEKRQVYQDFDMLNHIKTLPNYPKQTNEHSAIHDARWNKKLHEFINSL